MARLLCRNYTTVNPRAVGISSEYALIPLDAVHLLWADLVICADSEHAGFVMAALDTANMERQVYSLDIPDNFSFGDKELEAIIQKKFDEIQELKDISRV